MGGGGGGGEGVMSLLMNVLSIISLLLVLLDSSVSVLIFAHRCHTACAAVLAGYVACCNLRSRLPSFVYRLVSIDGKRGTEDWETVFYMTSNQFDVGVVFGGVPVWGFQVSFDKTNQNCSLSWHNVGFGRMNTLPDLHLVFSHTVNQHSGYCVWTTLTSQGCRQCTSR